MHVLVLESASGASADAEQQLRDVGHEVSRCHEPGDDAFPCKGITGTCPLERGDVDILLTVREPNRGRPAPLEDGVVCGLRHRIPLVVAGRNGHPYGQFAARTVDPRSDLAGACESVLATPLEPHSGLAAAAAREVLERHEIDSEVLARVFRRDGRLDVEVVVSAPDVPAGMLTTRVIGALRRFDPYAAGIDVKMHRA